MHEALQTRFNFASLNATFHFLRGWKDCLLMIHVRHDKVHVIKWLNVHDKFHIV